jgi:hypothetical protein
LRGAASPGTGCARKKTALAAAFRSEFAAEIEALTEGAVDAWDLEAVETAVFRKTKQFAARLVEQRFNADLADHAGPSLPCSCGKAARYAGRRAKLFQSALGPLHLERAYYYCKPCKTGFCPRDRALGLEGGSLTPATLRMVGHVGALVSFKEGHELLRDLAGADVSIKQVEREAERLGCEISLDEKAVVTPGEPAAGTIYMGVDGTGVPMRKAENKGRKGKQPDGSAKTREVKLCVVWTAEKRNKKGTPERDEGSISYSAAIESAAQSDVDDTPSDFAARMDREAKRRGFDRAKRQVLLGDGAQWIWNTGAERYPQAIQIVDQFHAMEHLSEVAKSVYTPGSDLGKEWAEQRHEELRQGKIDSILRALLVHAAANDTARKCVGYFRDNRQRMRYPEFRAAGLCVTTGVVEAGCKVAIGTRCKRAGMHWTVAGADAIISLRCARLSGRFEDFWERRAAA